MNLKCENQNVENNKQSSKKPTGILYVMMAICGLLIIAGCYLYFNGPDDSKDFQRFLEDNEAYSDLTLPSGANISYFTLERDKDKYYTVLDFSPCLHGNCYAWGALDHITQKTDMEYMANAVIEYAKSKKWDNNYYLYTTVFNGGVNFVYNCETSSFYYPKDIDIFIEMYRKFETMRPNGLIGNGAGEKFLLENGMGEVRHEEVEVTYMGMPYNVYIKDGKLKEYGYDDSVKY